MTIPLEPIKPKRISDQVFDQLRELIFRGELKPGDKVMPERELSAALKRHVSFVLDFVKGRMLT